jgi:Flp pilus assembly protein TadD
LICVGLTVATLAVYGQVVNHQFINLDDESYIYDNPTVKAGLTAKGIIWAFTTFHAANWHPLTWLSHMLDSQLFGLTPGLHLLTSTLIHTVNTLILFLLLKKMTDRIWRSAIVAALFALHPMHVESVAWAAERKDVLSTFFGLLCLLAYVRYAQTTRTWRRFFPVIITLGLGLMAKPMLVTWPFVMLLLDYWPLKRIKWLPSEGIGRLVRATLPLAREKIPLFVLVGVSMVITYIAQSLGGAVREFTEAPVSLRLSNALVSTARYIYSTFWPNRLGVYYPFPLEGIPAWQIALAFALLVCITVVAIRAMNGYRYLIAGWGWYLVTLVPVIGLVQVGGQAMADRYSYIPSIGLFVMLVWGLADYMDLRRVRHSAIAAATAVLLIIIGSLAWIQVGLWRDSVTLYQHTLSVTSDNLAIRYNLAHALGKQGRLDEATVHFTEALRIKPDFFDAAINLGITLSERGKFAEAVGYLERAVQLKPDSGKAHLQLALALAQSGKNGEAVSHFTRALEVAPDDPEVHTNWGLMLARLGRLREASDQLNEAIRLDPNIAEAHNNLGLVLLMQGNPEKSIPHFSTALRLKPDLKVAQDNLNRAQAQINARRE